MPKNNRLEFKVSSKTRQNFEAKAKALGLDLTEFIEKISNEPISFIRIEFKKGENLNDE